MSRLPHQEKHQRHGPHGHGKHGILWVHREADGKAYCEECGGRLKGHDVRGWWRLLLHRIGQRIRPGSQLLSILEVHGRALRKGSCVRMTVAQTGNFLEYNPQMLLLLAGIVFLAWGFG